MKAITTLNSLQSLNRKPVYNKPQYRPRYKVELTEDQQHIYNVLLHGLKAYDRSAISKMSEEDRRSIVYTQDKAWSIINQLKQQKMNSLLGHMLGNVFPNLCGDAVDILLKPVQDSTFVVSSKLKECNVSQITIIQEFINRGLLPKNFLSL